MQESNSENFNHLKIHSQFSICEGAIKIDDLKDISKDKKIKALGLCDTSNLCGALEFAEKLSKSGSQPIIGTQINFRLNDTTGLLPLFALNENGYKTIIKLSSLSFLRNDELSEPHLDFDELLNENNGVAIFSGTVNGLIGQLFNRGKFSEINEIYSKLKDISKDNRLKAVGLCDTSNLCGALEFAEKLSKSGSQPIIGTQINFKLEDTTGLIPLSELIFGNIGLDDKGLKLHRNGKR